MSIIREFGVILRYAGSGIFNTFLGLAVIYTAMIGGISPHVSNIMGYIVGFVVSFFLTKRFVFRSSGKWLAEAARFILAFAISFAINFATLWLLLYFAFDAWIAQLVAVGAYTGSMYVLTRLYVFRS